MCFFHVVKNVMKATKDIPSLIAASLLRHVYDLHFVRTDFDFHRFRVEILLNWLEKPYSAGLAGYMNEQRLK